jgi:signal transduction histidine kinase
VKLVLQKLLPSAIVLRRRLTWLFFMLIVCFRSANAQGRLDSLQAVIQKLSTDSTKVDALNRLSYEYWNTNPLEGVEFGIEALRLADSLGYLKGKAEAQKSIGVCYWSLGSYDPALRSFFDGLKTAQLIGDNELLNRIEHNMALVHEDMGNIDQAVYYFRKNIDWYLRTEQKSELPRVFNNLGTAYFQAGMLDSSLANYHRGLALAPAEESEDAKYLFINLAEAYFHKKDLDQARHYLNKAIAAYSKVDDKSGLVECYTMLGKLNIVRRDYVGAQTNLSEAWQLAKQGGFSHFYPDLLKTLASLDSARGNFKDAFLHYRQAVSWQDSLKNFRQKSEYERLLIQYRTDQKEKENQLLKQANVISQIRIEDDRRTMMILLVGSATILMLVLYFTYKRNQYRKRIEAAEIQSRLRQEKERIAQDLHDNIGSQLTSLSLGLNKISKEPAPDPTYWKVLNQSVSATMSELRDTIWAINKEEVTMEQLGDKLRNLIWRLRQSSERMEFEFELSAPGTLTLKPMQAVNLFRIIQEAINNSCRHSEAQRVSIDLRISEDGNELQLAVEDNGKGFEADQPVQEDHYGLTSMKKRAVEIKARLTIQSAKGSGTRLTLSMPLQTSA